MSDILEDVQMITLGADVQKRGIYYVVRGWGFHSESWLLDHGFIGGEMSDILHRLRLSNGVMLDAEREEAAAEIERLRQADVAWASDTIKLLVTIKYLIGIAERGEGREINSNETAEGFVLAYVKKLESEIDRLRGLLREYLASPLDRAPDLDKRASEALGDAPYQRD